MMSIVDTVFCPGLESYPDSWSKSCSFTIQFSSLGSFVIGVILLKFYYNIYGLDIYTILVNFILVFLLLYYIILVYILY